jgi:hypothetical protein
LKTPLHTFFSAFHPLMSNAHAHAVFDHEAAASAAGDLAPPSLLAEFCCLVVVAVIGALMWRWWRHHSRYEAAQHARDALFFESVVKDMRTNSGGPRSAAMGGLSRSASLVPQSLAAGSRRTSSCSSSQEYEAPDAQQQRHRYAQLKGTLAAYDQELGDHAGSRDAHALDQPWLGKKRSSVPQECIPGFLCVSDPCIMAGVDAFKRSPLAGPPNGSTSAGPSAPGGGPRTAASSGSRYTAQLLKRRGNTGGSVSPISRTTSSSSQISRTLSGNSPAISRSHSFVSEGD